MEDEQREILDRSNAKFQSEKRERRLGERSKLRDFDSFLMSGGMKKCSKVAETAGHKPQRREEKISETADLIGSLRSHKPAQLMTSPRSIEPANATTPHSAGDALNMKTSGVGLNLVDNPFYPYKELGQLRPVAAECGSTTGPVESESLRMWKEMKQNGFLSSSHRTIPIPRQREHHPKRSKQDELKKKSDIMPNKCPKVAAPTGLLSGLNPGIVKHVRNSKQINSIIEAMLQSEKSANQMQSRPERKDVTTHSSAGNQFSSLHRPSSDYSSECVAHMIGSGVDAMFCHESSTRMQPSRGFYDGNLALGNMAPDNAVSTSNNDSSSSHDSILSLSLKGASVAGQWLDLLQQDIKGRLAALKRSKKRVRNAIETELPHLQCSESGSGKDVSDVHMAQWKSNFTKMEKALHEEGRQLENWLKQVQDMQNHCERGLKHFGVGHSELHAEASSGLKEGKSIEMENAVRAAAAAIYSTCNLIATK